MDVKKKYLFLWVIILIPYFCIIPAIYLYLYQLKQIENASFIIINKADYTLSQFNYKGELLQKYRVAIGKYPGNKVDVGDLKTPEGVFKISSIEDSSTWTHDFKDDTIGLVYNAYGPYFIRLGTSRYKGIGIHGTHDNRSIGTRVTEGCIRMNNNEVKELVKNLKTSSIVVIVPGIDDQKVNYQRL